MDAPPPMLRINAVEYTLTRTPTGRLTILGSGGFGIVVRATTAGGLAVALKLVFCANAEQIVDARGEQTAQNLCAHPNIIRLRDFLELPDGPAARALKADVQSSLLDLVSSDPDRPIPKFFKNGLSMHALCVLAWELVDGPELFDWFSARAAPNISEAEARGVFTQLVAAVACLHEQGYAHRDIKLENALVTPNGELKLIDFGMLTQTRTVTGPSERGSPTYLAPELRGPGQLDLFAADVFSLGVTLYIMVAGAMPWFKTHRLCPHFADYRRLRAGQGVRDHVRRDRAPVSCRAIADTMSAGLVQLLDDCMSLDPGVRPTAAQLLGYAWLSPDPAVNDPPPTDPPALAAEDSAEANYVSLSAGGDAPAQFRGLSAGEDSPQWRGSAGPQYRSLGVDEEPQGFDDLMPIRQVAFRGAHWE